MAKVAIWAVRKEVAALERDPEGIPEPRTVRGAAMRSLIIRNIQEPLHRSLTRKPGKMSSEKQLLHVVPQKIPELFFISKNKPSKFRENSSHVQVIMTIGFLNKSVQEEKAFFWLTWQLLYWSMINIEEICPIFVGRGKHFFFK